MKLKTSIPKLEGELDISRDEMEFLSKIVPKTIRDAAGVLGDNVAAWRFNNKIKNLQLAKENISKAGFTVKEVPLKTLYSIFQNAEIEDDPTLQEKWGNLLANAATGMSIKATYIGVLKELSGADVSILDFLYGEFIKGNVSIVDVPRAVFSAQEVGKRFNLAAGDLSLIIENFNRLRICQPPSGDKLPDGRAVATFSLDTFSMTLFGFDFVKTCSWQTK